MGGWSKPPQKSTAFRTIAAVSGRQRKDYPALIRCGGHMKFGIPSAPCSSDGLNAAFFKAPIPSGWTLMQVESRLITFTWIWMIPSCCKCKNAAYKTPFFAQRFTRTQITCQSPYSLGKLLHLLPFSTMYSTAFNTSRLLIFAGFRCLGKQSLICSYCSIVSFSLLFYHNCIYVNSPQKVIKSIAIHAQFVGKINKPDLTKYCQHLNSLGIYEQ